MSADPIMNSYLDGNPNGGVYKSTLLSLFTYTSQNPLRYIDPTGLSEEELESITAAINSDLNEIWNNTTSSSVQDKGRSGSPEWALTMVSSGGRAEAVNKRTDNKHGAVMPDVKSIGWFDDLLGTGHTHPRQTPPSVSDLLFTASPRTGDYHIVETGSSRYGVEVKDAGAAGAFYTEMMSNKNSHGSTPAHSLFKQVTLDNLSVGASPAEAHIEGLKQVLQTHDTGMILYQTTDRGKVDYAEIK